MSLLGVHDRASLNARRVLAARGVSREWLARAVWLGECPGFVALIARMPDAPHVGQLIVKDEAYYWRPCAFRVLSEMDRRVDKLLKSGQFSGMFVRVEPRNPAVVRILERRGFREHGKNLFVKGTL